MCLNDADDTSVDNAEVDTNMNTEDYARSERSLSLEAVARCDSLQDLDRCSPTPSAASVERYLNQPAGQDSVPTAAIESALQDNHPLAVPPVDARLESPSQPETSAVACSACRARKSRCNREIPTCAHCQEYNVPCIYREPLQHTRRVSYPMRYSQEFMGYTKHIELINTLRWQSEVDAEIPTSRQQSPMGAFSTVGSESSVGSRTSFKSSSSYISVDARGSRRGRKRWARPSPPPVAHRDKRRRPSPPGTFISVPKPDATGLSDNHTEMSKDSRDEVRVRASPLLPMFFYTSMLQSFILIGRLLSKLSK
jgi:hypothetical protein